MLKRNATVRWSYMRQEAAHTFIPQWSSLKRNCSYEVSNGGNQQDEMAGCPQIVLQSDTLSSVFITIRTCAPETWPLADIRRTLTLKVSDILDTKRSESKFESRAARLWKEETTSQHNVYNVTFTCIISHDQNAAFL